MAINENLKVIISAENKSKGAFDEVGGQMGKLKSLAGSLATAVGVGLAGAFSAASAFGVSAFKAFMEAERETALATKSLENVVMGLSKTDLQKWGGDSAKAFQELSGWMMETSKSAIKLGFDDEAAAVSLSKLFAVTKDQQKASEELKLAMDLAAFSGRGLEEATDALMKVHAGGARILKEFGIAVEEGTTAEEALALVHQRVAGTAQEMASTTSGQLAVLGESWTNLKEDVGASLAEAVMPFIQQLTDWVSSDQTRQLLGEITGKLGEFTKQMAPIIVQILPAFIKVLGFSLEAIKWLSQAFMGTADALGTVIFKVTEAINWFKNLIDKITEAINKIKEFFSAAGKTAGATLKGLVGIGGPIGFGLPFQEGGYVRAPLGQAVPAILHGGETVLPAGAGIGGITLNISGNMFLDDEAAEKFGDRLISMLKRELRI